MAIKISELGNLNVWTDTTYIPAVNTASVLTTVKSTAGELKTYILDDIPNHITALYANANAQASSIYTVSVQVISANLGIKGYVDLGNTIQSGATTAANIGMKGYVDQKFITADTNAATANTTQNNVILLANVGMKGYVDFGNTIQAAAISAANLGMKGYVDNNISSTAYSNVQVATYLPVHDSTLRATTANIASGTSSVDSATGALRVMGGVGIAGDLYIAGVIMPNTNGASNIGSSGQAFNTVHAKATTAQYADLAELYIADTLYEAGTVLAFGGDYEVTIADLETTRVAGIVSTDPAYLMNSTLTGQHTVMVALQGRVPCRVQGTIRKGDMLVSAGNGYAKATETPKFGAVIGKSLVDFDGTEGIIEVVVGRL